MTIAADMDRSGDYSQPNLLHVSLNRLLLPKSVGDHISNVVKRQFGIQPVSEPSARV